MATLPPLSLALSSSETLANALSTLFESSPVLLSKLVPQLSALFTPPPSTYTALIDLAITTIAAWDVPTKAAFIAAHPRIGESANLSHLSRQEQAAKVVPPEVLARLEVLNGVYEKRYPGLRYITFVNGRSRAEVRDEMEAVLGVEEVGGSAVEDVSPVEVGGKAWMEELDRAIVDVGRIAKSRLRALGAL